MSNLEVKPVSTVHVKVDTISIYDFDYETIEYAIKKLNSIKNANEGVEIYIDITSDYDNILELEFFYKRPLTQQESKSAEAKNLELKAKRIEVLKNQLKQLENADD